MNYHQALLTAVLTALIGSVDASAQQSAERELTPAAKKTIQIISDLEFDPGKLSSKNLDEIFGRMMNQLASQGVTVRLRKSGKRETPSGEFTLPKSSLLEFMKLFDEWAGWGWIVYDDGSITYFDVQCACCWPKGGVGYHEEQYQAGTPEAMRIWEEEQLSKLSVKSAARGQKRQ